MSHADRERDVPGFVQRSCYSAETEAGASPGEIGCIMRADPNDQSKALIVRRCFA